MAEKHASGDAGCCKSPQDGEKNVRHPEMAEPQKILPPSLHIKLALMKSFVKFMDGTGQGFEYLATKFSQSINQSSGLPPLQKRDVRRPASG